MIQTATRIDRRVGGSGGPVLHFVKFLPSKDPVFRTKGRKMYKAENAYMGDERRRWFMPKGAGWVEVSDLLRTKLNKAFNVWRAAK
jgi:hypothetical protein